jgi:hypothetical protein
VCSRNFVDVCIKLCVMKKICLLHYFHCSVGIIPSPTYILFFMQTSNLLLKQIMIGKIFFRVIKTDGNFEWFLI